MYSKTVYDHAKDYSDCEIHLNAKNSTKQRKNKKPSCQVTFDLSFQEPLITLN